MESVSARAHGRVSAALDERATGCCDLPVAQREVCVHSCFAFLRPSINSASSGHRSSSCDLVTRARSQDPERSAHPD
eukprot:5561545-Pleurochrysis_carterae.AAC.1